MYITEAKNMPLISKSDTVYWVLCYSQEDCKIKAKELQDKIYVIILSCIMPYIEEFENIFQDLMHKVPQHPLCVLMLETRTVYETGE